MHGPADDMAALYEPVDPAATSLSLANRGLTAVPEFVAELTALTSLDLRGNQLTELPGFLGNRTGLTTLDVGANQLTELPGFLGNLTGLTTLDVGANQLTELPGSLASLTGLTTLDLSHNELPALPDWIGGLSRLTRLYVNANRLSSLTESVGDLAALTTLAVSHNELYALPGSLGRLVRLNALYLAANRLSALPECLCNLENLTALDLSNNWLETLPECLSNLRRLTRLDVSRNHLATLPDFVTNFRSLTYLDASRNQLTALPGSFRSLRALTSLHLGDNRLASLPDALCELTSLVNLEAWSNELTDLPECLGKLPVLRNIDLWDNALKCVPKSFGQLVNLNSLDLSDNNLASVPATLGKLESLTSLNVSGNPLASPLLEISADGTAATKTYLSLVADESAGLWTSKLLVVGEGSSGKTSLVKALRGEPYDPDEPSTHGIRILDVSLPHPGLPDITMQLSSWDFGGQDIYHATHQFFLSDRSLIVLLWNALLGWEHAKLPYWLDIIKARAPHAQVILVATHGYERPVDMPFSALQAAYPQIVGGGRVDNRTGKGIAELRQVMASAAVNLALMGSRWPAAWATGVKAITKTDLQHTTPEELRRRLAAVGVTDSAHQTYLLRALHLLGEILYFDQDEVLRDTVILRPQWVTEYIAKVLDSPEVAARDGVLSREEERRLWSDLDPGLRDRLLLMMENFDLSYRITDDPYAASLVVECLPWESPPYEQRWETAGQRPGSREIRMRYQLSVLPPGVPTWFIAREHRFTSGTHWRTGALLSYTGDDKTLGLIRADWQDKTVELAVRGPVPQLFFGVLQDGFESTLRRYRGLEITRLVPCSCAHGDGTQPGEPCQHVYQYGPLLRRLERGVRDVECELSFRRVSVGQLLFGIAPTPADEIMTRLSVIDSRLADFRTELTWINREFLKALRRQQARMEAECPSIFTLTPVRTKVSWPISERLELRLYCEQPGAFHGLGEPPYVIRKPARWVTTIGPYLNTLITVLKHTAPLAGPVLGLTSDYLAKQLSDEVNLMTALVSQLPEIGLSSLAVPEDFSEIELDVDYRMLHALLCELDPSTRWAGLSRVYTPEGQVLWLCRDHARQYGS
jgi:internalin A